MNIISSFKVTKLSLYMKVDKPLHVNAKQHASLTKSC